MYIGGRGARVNEKYREIYDPESRNKAKEFAGQKGERMLDGGD